MPGVGGTAPGARRQPAGTGTVAAMCRNITPLRGLAPPATREEIDAAALQYVRKVGSMASVSAVNQEAVDRAVERVAEATADLLAELTPRKQPPKVDPPLRQIAARSAG